MHRAARLWARSLSCSFVRSFVRLATLALGRSLGRRNLKPAKRSLNHSFASLAGFLPPGPRVSPAAARGPTKDLGASEASRALGPIWLPCAPSVFVQLLYLHAMRGPNGAKSIVAMLGAHLCARRERNNN